MRLLVLFGSQTGTAQDVAEQIWRESKLYGFSGPVLPMDEYPIEQLAEERLVVFVAATTGDGDEPDNMRQTWKFLLRRSLPPDSLAHMQFACLGLGDSSYAKFNYAAKKLHKRLQQLGAHALLPAGLCDDQHDHGLSAVSLPWIAQLWQKLAGLFPLHKESSDSTKTVFKFKVDIVAQPKDTGNLNVLQWPYKEPCHEFCLRENRRTTSADHFQDVRFLRLQGPDTLSWQPGDVLQVRPCNSPQQIESFFALVAEHKYDFDRDTVVHVSSRYDDMATPLAYGHHVTVFDLAKYVWDFSHKPRQRAFELLALNCEGELEREKLLEFTTAEGLDDLINYVNRPRRTILEVLHDFRHSAAKLNLQLLLELFPIIQTRSFSIASDPSAGSLDLLVAVVEYKTKLSTPRLGLCSNWLRSLEVGAKLLGTIKPGTMRLPPQPDQPIIMIGPGTGIAPFRSIIQHRASLSQHSNSPAGDLVVFFGCRGIYKDFHFAEDFAVWQSLAVAKAHFAFSRDQEHKIYVQDVIKLNKENLRFLIEQRQAFVLVAGASKNMPKSVKEAFVEVMGGDEAYIEQMIKARRYQEETWS